MNPIEEMVKSPHPVYVGNFNYWQFLLDSYEGGVDYCNGMIPGKTGASSLKDFVVRIFVNGQEQKQPTASGNLFQHPKERLEDYQDRLRMSYYYNFCAPVVDIYANHLFKDSVIEEFKAIEDTVDQVRENIDLKGSSIEEFRRELATNCQIYGHCFVIVDSPKTPSGAVVTRKDQIDQRAFPYVTIYAPHCIINWTLDVFGSPYWVLLREYVESNVDPQAFNKSKIKDWNYKLWTRDGWARYDREYKLIDQGTHPVGEVPIVCVYDKKSLKEVSFLGIATLADIAFVSRDIYNSCSELKQILRDQTFAFLAINGTATEYDELSVGTMKGLLYPEGRNVPQYVSPPADNATTYFTHIDRQVRKIYQLAKLEGGSAHQEQTAEAQTGVSKAWDFNETNAALAKKALNLEDGERKIWQMFAKWEGKKFDGRIQYPNEFSMSSLMDDLQEAEKSARLALGETFDLEVRKAIHKKKFPRAAEEMLKDMENESKAALGQQRQQEQQQTNGGNGPLGNRFREMFKRPQGGNGS